MYSSAKNTIFCNDNKLFLSHSYQSEVFEAEYKKFYNEETKAKELFLQILIYLEKVISEGDINHLKNLSAIIGFITNIEPQLVRRDFYDNSNNPIKGTNLIILACKYNQLNILEYLLDGSNKILENLSIDIGKIRILPNDKDDSSCNAFYYGISSGNVQILDTLISKWPGNYFAEHSEQLDEIISFAYEHLKLKNILLTDEVDIFVQRRLINLRFFSKSNSEAQSDQVSLDKIKDRISFILESINLLKSSEEEVNERFLYVAKFVAQNIYVLKHQLKSTYSKLPWEEIEFCLISFVTSYTKQQEINLCCRATLNKEKLLNHLDIFSKILQNVLHNLENLDITKVNILPNIKREDVIAKNYNQFKDLYDDYKQIRDNQSLMKIRDCTKLAMLADTEEKTSKIIITRSLQVIGEYMKNTLQSPKLSNTTSELLLFSLPTNTREIVKNLRNSLSHAYSLSTRMKVQENARIDFFTNVQNDIKKIYNVITSVLCTNKLQMIRTLLKQIKSSENLKEIKELVEILNNSKLGDSSQFELTEHEILDNLIHDLSNKIINQTSFEEMIFNEINDIINYEKTKIVNMSTNYLLGFNFLKALSNSLSSFIINSNIIRGIRFFANNALKYIKPNPKIENQTIKKVTDLVLIISDSVKSRTDSELEEINILILTIINFAEFELGRIKWVEELREQFNKKNVCVHKYKKKEIYEIIKENNKDLLDLKLSELKCILKQNKLNNQSLLQLISYKSSGNLQAIIEMLLLDIMSIFGSSEKYLENNLLFSDDYSPLLIGKALRNHLAHDNTILEISLSDPSTAIVLNALTLITENIVGDTKKIGKIVKDDILKIKFKYYSGLATVTNKKKMFVALEEGNLEDLKKIMKEGADINSRTINCWTALHFAAKGPSLEVFKFVLHQNVSVNAKDIVNQSPLHIAAAYGRNEVVKFLVEELGMFVNDCDINGKTPLHLAAENGHKDIVKLLKENKANTMCKDLLGMSPIHHAVAKNYKNVVEFLVSHEISIDCNKSMSGFTLLHIAAENGFLELVIFLLKKNANVNAVNQKGCIPLHTAALNGHVNIVNALVSKGANINARNIDGCTPLHYAVENGHEKVVDILLQHGVDVNVADSSYYNTPLHYAAKDGFEGIVKRLLQCKANANMATHEGITPLYFASYEGHIEIVIALLKHGVDISAKSIIGYTPLHAAVLNGHKEIVDVLIKNQAHVNAKANQFFITPLHLAVVTGQRDISNLLILNNAFVNAKDIEGFTPLHKAAIYGKADVVDLLVKNEAEVNIKSNLSYTPLHLAVMNGNREIVDILLHNKAEVLARNFDGYTPMHLAVSKYNVEVIDILIKNGADVNARSNDGLTPMHMVVKQKGNLFGMLTNIMTNIHDITPIHHSYKHNFKKTLEVLIANGGNINGKSNDDITLLSLAVENNYKEIVEVLISNGADVLEKNSSLLMKAVNAGYIDIVKLLLQNKADINDNTNFIDNMTLLHIAAYNGYKDLAEVLIAQGADINAVTNNNLTPLHIAARNGFSEIVRILIANKANINYRTEDIFGATPLHLAAMSGHCNVVDVLLDSKVDTNIKGIQEHTALELAVMHGHLQVVKTLLKHKKDSINSKIDGTFTLLHIAAHYRNLEIVKYLVDEGADINTRCTFGSKPIHIAAREGHADIVKYFLCNGINVSDVDAFNQTLLHHAAIKNQYQIAEYLISQGADVNAKDSNKLTPMHTAAKYGSQAVIKLLLKSNAYYNTVDKLGKKPLKLINISEDSGSYNLLASTEKLFEAVKNNNSSEVEICLKVEPGIIVNVKNADNATPLHYAAWKGYVEVVNVLLKNKANPNAVGKKGFTALHYASKFSHLFIVEKLLSNGAIYNALSDTCKTPFEFAVDKKIISLFQLIRDSFKNINNGNPRVVTDLRNVKSIETVKAVMNARDTENKSLIVCAIDKEFLKTEQLKLILQDDISVNISIAHALMVEEKYQEALNMFQIVLERRKNIFGPNNPATLDIQIEIAKLLYKQHKYVESLNILEVTYQQLKYIFGKKNKYALETQSFIALILHRQGKDDVALDMYKKVYKKQRKLLGESHLDILRTKNHMALVLNKQGKYEEALCVNYEVFEKYKCILGTKHPLTLVSQNNIGMVLNNQGKTNEALKVHQEVYNSRKQVLGPNHSDTLRTLQNLTFIQSRQKNYDEAIKSYNEVYEYQKSVLGPNHYDTINTGFNFANILLSQGKTISALKLFKEGLDQRIAVLGPNHPDILKTQEIINKITIQCKFLGTDVTDEIQNLENNLNNAANNGDKQTVCSLLQSGGDVNGKDSDGRTPLHFAVNNGHIDVVQVLLKNGADATLVTTKGNTPLHTAVTKNYKHIVEILLQHITHKRLNDVINAKTTITGATSLHVAAKNGTLEIIKILLTFGAMYNVENKDHKTPLDLSKDKNVTNFLKQIAQFFEDVERGNVTILNKLRLVKPDELLAATNARNKLGKTLLQVAISNKFTDISSQLVEILKKNRLKNK